MAYRMKITYDEIVSILDVKYINGSTIGYTLVQGIYEKIDVNWILKPLLPSKLEVNVTIDDITLRSN